MANTEKSSKSGFVIKLSSETVQKLAEEDQLRKDEAKSHDSSEKLPISVEENLENSSNKNNDIPMKQKDVKGQLKEEKLEATPEKNNEPSWGEYAQFVTYEGEDAIYTDPSSQQRYQWNKTTNCWELQKDVPGRTYSYENDTHVYTDADGSKCFYDAEKKAWIPKVDDDFLAFYQMSYGFVDNVAPQVDKEKEEKNKKEDKKPKEPTGVKRKVEPQWFEPEKESNTKVYVSNLPLDLTEEEFVNLMQKCGLVERDPSSQNMKVKLYTDKEQGCFKGDALCTYIKIESVDLALNLLDGSDFKGQKIKVERAHFQLKGEYNPALKPKKKRKKELEKIKKMQQKLFDWRPEKFIGERSKHERVVIVKNLFHPSDFDKDVQLILDYQQDLREESAKCGEVRKVVIYDRHPEGVAQITMKEPEQADAVVQLINGRWFGKKQITAEIWDGRTKYRIAETDADITKRIEKWDKFLEQNEAAAPDLPADGEGVSPKEKVQTTEANKEHESKNVPVVSDKVTE